MKIKLYSERAIAVHGCSFGLKLTDAQYKKLSDLQEKWIYVNYCGDYTLPAFNSVGAVDVFHFDIQKNLPTPKLTVGKQFNLRLLWTYLFGIFCALSNNLWAHVEQTSCTSRR